MKQLKLGLSSMVFGALSLTTLVASAEFICTVSHTPMTFPNIQPTTGDFGFIEVTFNSAANCGGSLIATHALCSANATAVTCPRNVISRFASHEQVAQAAQMLISARIANLPVSRVSAICNNNSSGCLARVNFGQ